MFQKNNKVVLTSLGALVLGGTSLPVTSSNFSLSFDFLRGGHSKSTNLNEELSIADKQLNLNTEKTQNMNLKIDQKIKEHKLESILGKQVELGEAKQMETQESSRHAKGVYSEIKKEDKALLINSESTAEVKKATQKISARESSDFRSAALKIQKYNIPSSPRRKRSLSKVKVQIEKLTIPEKKSIQKHYEQFLYLNQKKDPLKIQLSEIDLDSRAEFQKTQKKECEVCQEVVDAMKKINWSGEELSLFNKTKKAWRKTDKPPKETQVTSTWGSQWNRNHPYNIFYREEGKFKQAVKKVIDTRKKYHETVNSPSWRLCGITVGWFGAGCGYNKKGSLEQDSQDASSGIELQIGSSLLEWMQQLGNQSKSIT